LGGPGRRSLLEVAGRGAVVGHSSFRTLKARKDECPLFYGPGGETIHHFVAFSCTVNTTSPEPVFPAPSRTPSTRTYVPGFIPSVLNLNVSVLLSNRPSAGKTLTHFLPLTANDAAVSRASGEAAVASMTTWSLSTPAVFTVTVGASWQTTNGTL